MAAVPFVGGCATMPRNTPAQDLAWERWYACNRFASVQLQRIDLEGHVTAQHRIHGEFRLWQNCMKEAAAKQRRAGHQIGNGLTSSDADNRGAQ